MNQQELIVKIKLEALITEREMMIVKNKEREINNESLAYDEKSFIGLLSEIKDLERECY